MAVLALAAWLRLRHLGLAEYDDDQAIALRIAHDILHGNIRTVGLASSTGASNPPLYVYVLAVVVWLHDGLLFATGSVALVSVVALALTYAVIRRRFGSAVALVTTALFATAPWAVLFGRHLWQQDYLPFVTASLLWSLSAVLERDRTRAALLVPVLFVIAVQLNLSAVALILPIVALFAYRARELDWRAAGAGVGLGILLLAPWLAHDAKHGFRDFSLIVDNGRTHHGGTVGTGALEAVRQTIHLGSAEGWTFIICLAYLASSRSGVRPHYLIVGYPVSFLLAALGLHDAAALLRRRSAALVLAFAAALAAAFVSFNLSFQAFVQRHGGTTGYYDVVYDDAARLADGVRARNMHVDRASVEYLVWGHLNVPAGATRIVETRDRLRDHRPLPCGGERRWFGPLEACFPRAG